MKLVRDKIPAIATEHTYTVATPKEKLLFLRLKLAEEVGEFFSARTSDQIAEELADVVEVLDAIIDAYGNSELVADVRYEKARDKGRFTKGFILEDPKE